MSTIKPIKAILFCRVSSREQEAEGYSLPAQERLLSEYAEKKGYKIAEKFSISESASGKQERKVFNEMLEYLKKNSDIKICVCEKVDRISRNFKDGVKLDDWLNEDETRELHFVKQSLVIHKYARSHEKFQWDIYLALARQYANNLSEEVRKGLDQKALEGWYPGSHKRGYKTSGEMGQKTWLIDTSTNDYKFIKKAFELYDTGSFTLRTLSKRLFEEGWVQSDGKQISTSEMHRILCDPFYCGDFKWKKKRQHGKHPPLITIDLFESVQERLRRKTLAGKFKKHTFLFGDGLLICGECNRTITAELQKGHSYYRCTKFKTQCTQKKYLREEEAERQIVAFLDSFKIKNKRLLEWIRKALKETHQSENEYHDHIIKELDKEYTKIKNRLSILYDDRVDGTISKEMYEDKRKQYEEQLNNLLQSKEKHTKANIEYMKLGMNIFELAQKGHEIYTNLATDDEKKELLHFIFLNLYVKDEKVIPMYKNGFQLVAEHSNHNSWQGQ